jgi:hypothetical protein
MISQEWQEAGGNTGCQKNDRKLEERREAGDTTES